MKPTYSKECAAVVGIWENNHTVPYPIEITFFEGCGGRASISVRQARRLIRDIERECRKVQARTRTDRGPKRRSPPKADA